MAKLGAKRQAKRKQGAQRRSGERQAIDRLREVQNKVSELEKSLVWLAASGALAGAAGAAVRAQRDAGLAITYQLGNEIIREFPDGRREVLGEVNPPAAALLKGIPRVRTRRRA